MFIKEKNFEVRIKDFEITDRFLNRLKDPLTLIRYHPFVKNGYHECGSFIVEEEIGPFKMFWVINRKLDFKKRVFVGWAHTTGSRIRMQIDFLQCGKDASCRFNVKLQTLPMVGFVAIELIEYAWRKTINSLVKEFK